MFSGIVEEMATVVAIKHDKENIDFTLRCSFVDELGIDQSVAHNGVCLTVVEIKDGTYTVTAMKETLDRSNLGLLKVGDKVNVERSMVMNGRLDGHIVQGHVDETAKCIAMKDADGSTYFTFEYELNKEWQEKAISRWTRAALPLTAFRSPSVILQTTHLPLPSFLIPERIPTSATSKWER